MLGGEGRKQDEVICSVDSYDVRPASYENFEKNVVDVYMFDVDGARLFQAILIDDQPDRLRNLKWSCAIRELPVSV